MHIIHLNSVLEFESTSIAFQRRHTKYLLLFLNSFQMKSKRIIFYICVLLLPSTVSLYNILLFRIKYELFRQISSQRKYQEVLDKIEAMIKDNRTINDIFKPAEEGYLGEGSYGVMYKGLTCHRTAGQGKITDQSRLIL